MEKRFDYQRFVTRRERLRSVTFGFIAAWWVALFVVGIGSSWSESMARLRCATVWDGLTVDHLLATGAWVSVAVALGGPWLVRNMYRPPQLFVVLRDFQSSAAAELATRYVRRRGARWGYWLTLENVDLRAADSVGGEVETDPEDERDTKEKPPVGSWWAVSFGLGLVLTTVFVLCNLDSAPLRWMRKTSDDLGAIGGLAFGVVGIVGICVLWFATTVTIRWVLLAVQRAVVLPGRVDSAEACRRVLDTIVSRVRRRATTLTLGPLPVVSVDDDWWRAAVERCIAEASLVVFILAGRESASLKWEIDHVRERFDPRRTLFIELGGGRPSCSGTGPATHNPATSFARDEERIDAAVRSMLFGDGAERAR